MFWKFVRMRIGVNLPLGKGPVVYARWKTTGSKDYPEWQPLRRALFLGGTHFMFCTHPVLFAFPRRIWEATRPRTFFRLLPGNPIKLPLFKSQLFWVICPVNGSKDLLTCGNELRQGADFCGVRGFLGPGQGLVTLIAFGLYFSSQLYVSLFIIISPPNWQGMK